MLCKLSFRTSQGQTRDTRLETREPKSESRFTGMADTRPVDTTAASVARRIFTGRVALLFQRHIDCCFGLVTVLVRKVLRLREVVGCVQHRRYLVFRPRLVACQLKQHYSITLWHGIVPKCIKNDSVSQRQ